MVRGHVIQSCHALLIGCIVLLASMYWWVVPLWLALVGALYVMHDGCLITDWANRSFAAEGHATHQNLIYWARDWGGWPGVIALFGIVMLPSLIKWALS